MDYLHDGWLGLFGLLKRNCINILIIFIRFTMNHAISYLIIIGEYNLMCFICVIVFEVNGDEQMILLQKNVEKNAKRDWVWIYYNEHNGTKNSNNINSNNSRKKHLKKYVARESKSQRNETEKV